MATDVVEQLRAAGCVFAEDEAALLIEASTDERDLADLVERRRAGEPLEHVVGFVEFCGSRYRLGPGVFVPRQRSALLVDEAVRLGGTAVLDLCCGCGALGLAVHQRLGGDLVSTDLSPDAVAYARANGVETAYVGDLFSAVPASDRGRFDLILANTPYVPSGAITGMPRDSRDFEPRLAVDGGADGMDLQRTVLTQAHHWLAPDGYLLIETSRHQVEALATDASDAGWTPSVVTDPDLGAYALVVRRPSKARG